MSEHIPDITTLPSNKKFAFLNKTNAVRVLVAATAVAVVAVVVVKLKSDFAVEEIVETVVETFES
jgi:hypothetical protein